MFFQNISKRKILLLIINALISILMISCVIFLYYYLPAATKHQQQQQRMFTVEKENSVHLMSSSKRNHVSGSSIANANVRISNGRRPPLSSLSNEEDQRSAEETAIDDTIYIDNDNYGDVDSYADNSGNYEKPVTAPVTIIERPIERKKAQQHQPDDDLYYENYDDTDDEDIVSSGNGKIVVNIKKPLSLQTPEPAPIEPVVENVYSVSSEIVSNLKNQYVIDDSSAATTKQINKPDDFLMRESSDDATDGGDEWTVEANDAKGKRLIGNNKSLVERSRQLLLCESARTGELCRMLFKGTVG